MIKATRTLKSWVNNLDKYLADGKEHIAVITHKQTEIAYGGWEDDINLEYCEANGIPVYNQNRNGGTIVCAKGNIGIAFVHSVARYKDWMLVRLAENLVDWIKRMGFSAELIGNDVLVDGYKVASVCGYNLPPDFKTAYEGMQISINQDMETIRAVCRKEMVKVPKGLSDYGVTTAQIKDFVEQWFEDLAITHDKEPDWYSEKGAENDGAGS